MTREMIITELQNRGYKAEAQTTIKNGVKFEGIRIQTGSNVAPVIYTESIIENAEKENKTLDEVVSAIIKIFEDNKSFNFDIEALKDKDFILNNLYIGLQKDSTENIIKKGCDLDGIESYLYIRGTNKDGSFSIKLNKGLLENANISEVEAWEKAETNNNEETNLESMAKVLARMMGMEYFEEMEKGIAPFYVISNKCNNRGASAILNKSVLSDFGKHYNTNKIVVLPSSIHEMLIAPYTEDIDLDSFTSMVTEVNGTTIDPVERLTDRAYIINI
jgi:hypothetical protein